MPKKGYEIDIKYRYAKVIEPKESIGSDTINIYLLAYVTQLSWHIIHFINIVIKAMNTYSVTPTN